MGISFTNVNICNQNKYTADVFARYLDRYYTSLGYERVDSSVKADINLYIFYKRTERWVTIYADIWEDTSRNELSEYARIYSKICSLPVFATGVYDGKEAVVAYCNTKVNEESVVISDRTPAPYIYFQPEAGSPFDQISPLLRYQGDKCRLAKVWKGTYEFPEQKLVKFTEMFGIDPFLVAGGYHRYEEGLKQSEKFKSMNYQVLAVSYHKTAANDQPQTTANGNTASIENSKGNQPISGKYETIASENTYVDRTPLPNLTRKPPKSADTLPAKTNIDRPAVSTNDSVAQTTVSENANYNSDVILELGTSVSNPKPDVKLEVLSADETIKEKFMCRVVFKNAGIATKGLCLYLSGDVITKGFENNCYDFVFCTVKKTTPDGSVMVFTKAFTTTTLVTNEKSLTLKIDDMDLNAGDSITFNFTFLDMPKTTEPLKIFAAPLENPVDGQCSAYIKCE